MSDAVEASVEGGGMEIFVFSGETTLEIVQRYNLFFLEVESSLPNGAWDSGTECTPKAGTRIF
ncbi:hypothetical protein [Algoriphagus boritolerans]|uniref:hypothetical protein n=1 Tax=Algoriphagus boritolerans TaxID=308111 RepID=UPI002FCE0E8D